MTTETDTPAPPFGEYIVTMLLAGPGAAGPVPRDQQTRAEWRATWGRFGENVAPTWATHSAWLRETATARGIRPTWPGGKFFGECFGPKGAR